MAEQGRRAHAAGYRARTEDRATTTRQEKRMTDTVATSADIPTGAEVVARAKALAPLISGYAEQTDRERRVPDAVIDALADAGLFKLGVPRMYGGYATGFETYCDVTAAIGEACGSTAWVTALINVCNWCISLFGDQAREEVFAGNASPRVCGVLAPSSQSRRVQGGLHVSGRWGYASGSPHAQWAMLGVPVVDEAGEQIDQGLALIPMAELSIENTWFVAGMRGTASDTIVATEVFVPDHRILSVPPANGNVSRNPQPDGGLGRGGLVAVRAGGGAGARGSFADASPLQRLWRDSSTAARHAVVLPEVNAEIYGKALLGVPYESNITPLI
jgi:3-hydroxy-9,10-secoandrosta-1,3,5(10)-triene-9,17-dione monooxygenase